MRLDNAQRWRVSAVRGGSTVSNRNRFAICEKLCNFIDLNSLPVMSVPEVLAYICTARSPEHRVADRPSA